MFCQKCKTPLRLDSSLDNLSPVAFKLLAGAGGMQNHPEIDQSFRLLYTPAQKQLYDQVSHDAPNPTFTRTITPPRHGVEVSSMQADGAKVASGNHVDMSFIMLNESQVIVPPKDSNGPLHSYRKGHRRRSSSDRDGSDDEHTFSHRMENTARMFEVLSARSDIDHPICAECTESLIERMERRLAIATKERDTYIEFLRNANADIPTEEETNQARKELAAVRDQEKTALAELEALESEKAALEEEITKLDQGARKLDEEEEVFWRERNAFSQVLTDFQNERDSVNLRYDHDSRQLERLQRTNVYNDIFCISHDGIFGTINGLRLGSLNNHPVPWPEINAAWGQACLLLATVADKLGCTLQGYHLNPLGSTSAIDKYDKQLPSSAIDSSRSPKSKSTSLPLYYADNSTLGIAFFTGHFDNAMAAFLECVRQVGNHVERTTRETARGEDEVRRLPYEIKRDKINDCNIKYGQNEAWTKACKFTLTCCKFLLAHASNISGSQRDGER